MIVKMGYSTMAHALVCYIEDHLDNFDIKEMSACFGFSEIYLRELFLKNVDIPIMQYYRRRKIIASAYKVLHSNKKIIDIALESGFSNHESYTRAFQKVFDITPSKFRLKTPAEKRPFHAGAYKLNPLIQKEKGRGDSTIMEQKETDTILYGIKKIEQGTYGSNTMFPICVKAVSEYLGDTISYAHIMAATGAAFRLVWNEASWDLSNIDIYHTLRESNDIYQYGAKALGREFSFLGREENTKKQDFAAYIKANLAKGYPCIALGIIGPPEPCIIAGYESEKDAVIGWNFFQEDAEFSAGIKTMDNGYFCCENWWENTDTQAVMHIGAKSGISVSDKDIVKMAIDIMEPRQEHTYAKGIKAYEAWKAMLLEEKWFENEAAFDHLFFKLLVQNDATTCIWDGRYWGAEYFKELSEQYTENAKTKENGKTKGNAKTEENIKTICQSISKHFNQVSGIAKEMMDLIGDWSNTENMVQNLGNRSIREKLGKLIGAAKEEDSMALLKIKELYQIM